jgi:hypothetical protein
MTLLLHREDLSPSSQETLAHLLFNSLLHLSQMKNLVSKDANQSTTSNGTSVNLVYLKYWELGTGYLKLSVINELVQSFRTTPRLLHPLLNTLFLLNKHSQENIESLGGDNTQSLSELGRDLTLTLLKVIESTDIPTPTPDHQHVTPITSQEQIVKASIMNLIMLQRIYPDVLKELKELVIDYNERLK